MAREKGDVVALFGKLTARKFNYTPYRLKLEEKDLVERLKIHRGPGTTARSGSVARWLLLILAAMFLMYWLFPEVVSELFLPEVRIEIGDQR